MSKLDDELDATPEFSDRVAAVTGRVPVAWRRIEGRGYTAARRLVARFADGTTAFIKCATTPDTARWIAVERTVYDSLGPQPFLPRYLGAGGDGTPDAFPFLVLEDLSGCHWPPPWTEDAIRAVRTALDQVHAVSGPFVDSLRPVEEMIAGDRGWDMVVADPAPFLSLDHCSREWLEAASPTLLAASRAAPWHGNELLHLDTRSDNLCLRHDGTAVLVDWNWVHRGNGTADLASWLPSLHAEGGPLPEEILPDAPEFAAWLAGFWSASAGLPPPPGAPRVREVQKRQLNSVLPWAVRALGLPPLDGNATRNQP